MAPESSKKLRAQRDVSVRSPYLVSFDGKFRVRNAPHKPPRASRSGRDNEEALARAIEAMRKLQNRLLANNRRALLIVFQALDAAGKDGTIKAVMSGINPAGCEVHSFKKPSDDELDHDFLWRVCNRVPERHFAQQRRPDDGKNRHCGLRRPGVPRRKGGSRGRAGARRACGRRARARGRRIHKRACSTERSDAPRGSGPGWG